MDGKDKRYTRPRKRPAFSSAEHSTTSGSSAAEHSLASSSTHAAPPPLRTSSATTPGFFSSASPKVQVSFDQPSLLLLMGILQELRTRNEIELAKIKIEEAQRQMEIEAAGEELEAAQKAQKEDEERFNSEIRPRMYA